MSNCPFDISFHFYEVIKFLSEQPDRMEYLRSETLNRIDEAKVEGENVEGFRNRVHEMLWAVNREEKICELVANEQEF